MVVTGQHWPEDTLVVAMLCGAEAVDGSVDCAQSAQIVMTPGPDGAVQGAMPVIAPPAPCPCVVLVTTLSNDVARKIPVAVEGVPIAPVQSTSPAARPAALHVKTRVEGGTTVSSTFGGPATRTLVVTITNAGAVAVPHPVVVARWGRDGHEHNVIPSRLLARLPAGATRTVHLSFELDPASIGSYEVVGHVTGATKVVGFHASTSTWPWGWLLLVLLLVQLLLLLLRNRARRRLAHQEVLAELDALDSPEAPGAVAATVAGPPAVREAATAPGSPIRSGVPAAAAAGAPHRGAAARPPISWRPPSGPPD